MTISIRGSASAWATPSTSAQASVVVTFPAHQAGDMIVVRAVRKPFTNPDTITIDNGFTAVAAGFANGSTANSGGAGSMAIKAFYKIATSSSEGTTTVTWGTSAAPGSVCAVVYQKGAGETWVTPTGAAGLNATAATTINDTLATHVAVASGDMVDVFCAWCDDIGTPTAVSISQPGVTYTVTSDIPATALDSGNSNDIAADGAYALATVGPSSGAATITANYGSSEEHIVWMTRLRVFTPETHDGSFTATGGGVVTMAGQKGGQTAATLTGGGIYSQAASHAGNLSTALTGGGVVTTAASHAGNGSPGALTGGGVVGLAGQLGAQSGVPLTGGGVVSLAGAMGAQSGVALTGGGVVEWAASAESVENHDGSFAITGGGTVLTGASTDRDTGIALTGGGVASTSQRKGAQSGASLTGGGVVSLGTAAARSTGVALTGGGVVATGSTSAHVAAAALTGGGVVTFGPTSARSAGVALTGGGVVEWDATQAVAKSGSFAITGGGTVTWSSLAEIPQEGAAPHRGGVRYQFPVMFPRRRGSFQATGSGSVQVSGRAEWNDDDEVLELAGVA